MVVKKKAWMLIIFYWCYDLRTAHRISKLWQTVDLFFEIHWMFRFKQIAHFLSLNSSMINSTEVCKVMTTPCFEKKNSFDEWKRINMKYWCSFISKSHILKDFQRAMQHRNSLKRFLIVQWLFLNFLWNLILLHLGTIYDVKISIILAHIIRSQGLSDYYGNASVSLTNNLIILKMAFL